MSTIKVLDHGFVSLVDSMPTASETTGWVNYDWGAGDARVVEAARVSYKSKGKTLEQDKRLLKYLYTNKHWSPFEQVKFTFHVKCPIFVARQWMRHRTFQFNEVSARYTEVPEEFYIPELARMQAQAKDNKQASGESLPENVANTCHHWMKEAYKETMWSYREMLSLGLSRELARMVLPVGLYTELFMSVDLRNLLHFIALRDHSHAQWEIQQYAKALAELASGIAPFTLSLR